MGHDNYHTLAMVSRHEARFLAMRNKGINEEQKNKFAFGRIT
ncbi:hypothetical protein P378_05930 [Desulforamulus profundi]|uniref:Uncharacterized protein n=1 Tax=Desulforamulus profundi TaxID=1383067 RepID=A0A2C6MH62_9FIRM|nr:hypothetical protein P378_05930 [Desulforamulus profundi]